jgi:two-component system CheB/CheR fusion protein
MNETITNNIEQGELELLRSRLEEANETINAIRTGKIDALLVQNDHGTQVYTLKSADQTYRVFIEKMNECAVTINSQGIILYCNSRFASTVKMPLTKVIGVAFENFIPQASKEVFTNIINKGWKSDSKGEIYLSDNDNEIIPFLLSVTKMEIEEGFTLNLLLTDLSIQKENEKQLRVKNDALELAEFNARKLNLELENKVDERTKDLLLSRERFKFLAENIPVIVWTADHNGDFDYANKGWREYSGLNFQQTQKSGWLTILHPEDAERTAFEWKKSVKENNPMHIEFRIKRAKDGMYRWHICSALPFSNKEGVTIAWFATCTDIHDQKLAIEKKEEFIGIASHELKTPLTGLKGYMQIMELHKEELSPAFYNYFTRAISL